MGVAGISPGSLFIVFFVALLVFGPSRLQTLGVEIGKAIKQFRKALAEDDIDVKAEDKN